MKELLARVIAELPEKEQQVLALYYFDDLTMKEVERCLAPENRGSPRFTPGRGAAAIAPGRDAERGRQ